MEGVLKKLLGLQQKNSQELKKQNNTLQSILGIQKNILAEEKARRKAAEREAQAAKRKAADKGPERNLLSDILKTLRNQEKDKKKGGSWWSNLLKGLTAALAPLLSALAALGNLGVDGLLKGGRLALRLAEALIGPLLRLMTNLLGRLFKFTSKLLKAGLEKLFGRNGIVKKAWDKATESLLGKDSLLRKNLKKIFGEKGILRTQLDKAFKALKNLPGGAKTAATKGITGLKALPGNVAKMFGAGGAFQQFFGKGGTLATIGANIKSKGLLGIGGRGLKMLKGGSILAGLLEGITTYQETGSATQAGAEGTGALAGAFSGGAAGLKIGAAIGTAIAPGVGTAIGSALGTLIGSIAGAFTGAKLGEIIYKAIKENTPFAPVLDYIDEFFRGYFGELGRVFDNFMGVANEVGRLIKGIAGKLGEFISGVWDSFTNEIEYFAGEFKKFVSDQWTRFTNWIDDINETISKVTQPIIDKFNKFMEKHIQPTLDKFNEFFEEHINPVLKEVGEFLEPIVKPLEKLTKRIINPLVTGIEDAVAVFKTLTSGGETLEKIFKSIGDLFPNPAKAGQQFGKALTGGIGDLFGWGQDQLRQLNNRLGFQTGGFVGTVPNQGGNGDRFSTSVAPGSVVLNQTAAGMFQSGGMVPVMLEQGEQVFGPRDPMAGSALAMNSMFPRFQEGGEVSGWQKYNPFRRKTYTYNLPEGMNIESIQAYGKTIKIPGTETVQDLARRKRDPKPDKGSKAAAAVNKEDKVDIKAKPGGPTPGASGDIAPGGRIDFIGDGSGFTGELKFIDANNKIIGSWGGISGVARNAGASQSARRNVGGTLNPLPDGSYPIENPMGPGSGAVGEWAAWINNPSGNIGNRGQIFMHNDIGNNGTAGCIGVMTDGVRGSSASMAYRDFYNRAMPKKVNVNLQSSAGKKFTVGELGTAGNTGGLGGAIRSAVGGGLRGLFESLKSGGGDMFKGMDKFLDTKQASGALSGVMNAFGPVADMILGPLQQVAEATTSAIGGGTNLTGGGTRAGTDDPTMNALLDAIAKAEGTTKSYGTMFGGAVNQQLANEQLTVQQAMDAAYANPGSSATGRYQFMYQTFKDLISWGVWDPNEKLTHAKQDEGARYLIERKRGVNVTDGLSKSEVAKLSWEWASIKGNNYTYGGAAQGYVGQDKFLKWVEEGGGKIQMQTGGVANVKGTGSHAAAHMVSKSQEAFAQKIASAMQPVVVPVPTGGGHQTQMVQQSGTDTPFPVMPAEDTSIVGMEYKYRITMGASV